MKTEFVANEGTKDQLYFDLTEKCIPMLHMKEDTFIEFETNDEYSIYTNKDKSKYTCVYFDII
jgi:adenine-specific DNA-methyltransferase